jgi:hypothetical protein
VYGTEVVPDVSFPTALQLPGQCRPHSWEICGIFCRWQLLAGELRVFQHAVKSLKKYTDAAVSET